MHFRWTLTSTVAAWLLIGGVATAEPAESSSAQTTAIPVAYPYETDRYGYFPPRRYAWRPWYSGSYRHAPSYDRYAPRWRYDGQYGGGSPPYRYYAPRSYGRSQPYYNRRFHYDRRYDYRDHRYDDRWTAVPREPLPRWAGTPRW